MRPNGDSSGGMVYLPEETEVGSKREAKFFWIKPLSGLG